MPIVWKMDAIEKDLDRLEHWGLSNKMQFKDEKSKVGRRYQKKRYKNRWYVAQQ